MVVACGIAISVVIFGGVVLAAIERISLAPIENHIIDELIVHLCIVIAFAVCKVRLIPHTIETRGTTDTIRNKTMVHSGMLSSPLRGIGTLPFVVFRIVESFTNNRPLHRSGITIVERETLLHRPCERAVIKNHIACILHIQTGIVGVGDVACTEADMAYDDVRLTYVYVRARDANATSWGSLSGNGDIRVCEFEFGIQIDSATDLKKYRPRRIIATAQCPTQRALHQVVIGAIIETGHVIHITATPAGSILSIPLSGRKSRCICYT